MGHGHNHHVDPEAGDRRVFAAIAVNMGLTVAQIVGGVISGSLALIADALHNFSDAISLIIAFGARKIARRPRDAEMTFGYGRVEVVAALINYTTLIVIGLYLLYEAAMRFADPQPVEGWLIVIIAGIALIVDAVTAALTYAMSKSSVNIRAAFLHNVADALGSVAVIIAGTLILLYDWRLIDPLVTVLIAGYIIWQSFREIGPVIRILMLGSPHEIETDAVLEAVRGIDGVTGIHHAHFWQMDEHRAALDAHVVIAEGRWNDADAVKDRIKAALADRFDIEHTTLELECARHACDDPPAFGGRGRSEERNR
ncbi:MULTISPECIES: cation diffusion facilitator family transporter [unclassified Roseivivax]|uniref:cation diffusion facilitator family transporter n=1 Tax=unclassified Roseivivax TaxID=2639302 RepID=UPI001268B231|nr:MULTISPECIES: cation diffusion facilitator family transporter [unclassified Roseivivax]QFS82924.1 Cadmium, cobalt and zinc/H(+)-K(+) antiporter [Roseivivax sp. THAF197b]QFT46694.1 Cadmium, cobalt and zinc/H(+)-K(+) antiporter [Roseivivax sp. THAF40]QFT63056.1 Cadmium, cobalt and zinc/H(+)-K(+) antiporter [Roseivivax sp. THAF30]